MWERDQLSTKNVGEIISTDRGTLMGPPDAEPGLAQANIVSEPRTFRPGTQGDVGVLDPCESYDEDDL